MNILLWLTEFFLGVEVKLDTLQTLAHTSINVKPGISVEILSNIYLFVTLKPYRKLLFIYKLKDTNKNYSCKQVVNFQFEPIFFKVMLILDYASSTSNFTGTSKAKVIRMKNLSSWF